MIQPPNSTAYVPSASATHYLLVDIHLDRRPEGQNSIALGKLITPSPALNDAIKYQCRTQQKAYVLNLNPHQLDNNLNQPSHATERETRTRNFNNPAELIRSPLVQIMQSTTMSLFNIKKSGYRTTSLPGPHVGLHDQGQAHPSHPPAFLHHNSLTCSIV